jgi:hypothetical protein
VTVHDSDTARLGALADTLCREEHLLEALFFRLEVRQLVFEAGSSRWAERTVSDVEASLQELGMHELIRAVQVADLSPGLGLPADASLRQLVAVSPEPWRAILGDHLRYFLDVLAAVAGSAGSFPPTLADFLRPGPGTAPLASVAPDRLKDLR